jgi:hypothetical protein
VETNPGGTSGTRTAPTDTTVDLTSKIPALQIILYIVLPVIALLLVVVAAVMCCKTWREKLNEKERVYAIRPSSIRVEDTSR